MFFGLTYWAYLNNHVSLGICIYNGNIISLENDWEA